MGFLYSQVLIVFKRELSLKKQDQHFLECCTGDPYLNKEKDLIYAISKCITFSAVCAY